MHFEGFGIWDFYFLNPSYYFNPSIWNAYFWKFNYAKTPSFQCPHIKIYFLLLWETIKNYWEGPTTNFCEREKEVQAQKLVTPLDFLFKSGKFWNSENIFLVNCRWSLTSESPFISLKQFKMIYEALLWFIFFMLSYMSGLHTLAKNAVRFITHSIPRMYKVEWREPCTQAFYSLWNWLGGDRFKRAKR